MKQLFRALCSLKFAIAIILCIAASLAVGTILESLYDTATSQFWVYRSWWFHLLLFTLGLEIFAVAMSRLPWKKGHTPFLLAHLGIITLLVGSWITEQYGLDGSLRVTEGEAGTVVEVNQPTLALSEDGKVKAIPVKWVPPNATFRPMKVPDYELRVDQLIPHADPIVSFVKNPQETTRPTPALHLQLEGGPMRIKQDFWLWAGDPGWSATQAGPARLILNSPASGLPKPVMPPAIPGAKKGPIFEVTADAGGTVSYRAVSSEGKVQTGRFSASQVAGQVLHPAWKGNVTVTLLEWIPHASANTVYRTSPIEYGDQAPPSAIHIVAGKGGPGAETWLGIGDRAVLQLHDREIAVGYYSQRHVLPFGVKLERFTVDHNAGTNDPSAYSSQVSIIDSPGGAGSAKPGELTTISMNEPLAYKGITFYQASYEDAQPRPITSIFSVNRDPGRWIKYTGSLLIVLGTILLFAAKYRRKKVQAPEVPRT